MLSPNGQISKRKTVQLMVALTILAWATQTLLHQWGFGAEVSALNVTQSNEEAPVERFVPGNSTSSGATIEMRDEATIVGAEVKLKQICRWADSDNTALAPIADLVIVRITADKPFKSISVNEIKSILQDAHVNLAGINFVGTISCTINRSDAHYDESVAMQQWIAARTVDAPESCRPAPVVAKTPVVAPTPDAPKTTRSLRELLAADVATAPESLAGYAPDRL